MTASAWAVPSATPTTKAEAKIQTAVQTGGDYPPEIQAILDRGRLVVAMTATDQFPFYFKKTDGGFDGIDVRFARKIAKELKVEVEFNRSAASFNDVVTEVARGRADIAISKLSRTLARAQKVIYTQPYLTFRQALMVNRVKLVQFSTESELPAFLKHLRNPKAHMSQPVKIGIIAKSSYVGFCTTYFPAATIVEYPTWEEAVAAVFSGDVLAVYRDELEIVKINSSREDASIKLKTVVLADLQDPIAMAVPWNSSRLALWLDIFLQRERLGTDVDGLLREFSETNTEASK